MGQIKNYYYIFFLFSAIIGYSQKQEIIILDEITNLPIEDVNIYYPNIEEGTFTNSDGKASVILKEMDLKISHVNYNELIIPFKELKNRKAILLKPKLMELTEVVIKSFNLEKALREVLDNYNKLYVSSPFEKECNFKETVLIDDQLKRLILTKINWWSKSYKKSNNNNDLKLRLGAIDYSKNEPMNIFIDSSEENLPSKSGFIEMKSLTNLIYLNSFITSFLSYTEGYHAQLEESSADLIIVSYETNWKTIKDVSSRSVGKVIFDKESKGIIEFVNKIEFKNKVVAKITSISQKQYSYETEKSTTRHSFYKNNDNKWSLKNFISIVDSSISYNGKTYSVVFENDIYLLKETKINKVSNDGLIDLTKPLYQNLPSNTITNSSSILLSEKEMKFIFSTK